MMKHSWGMLSLFLACTVLGCGDGSMHSRPKMEVTELGLFMYAPSGWRVDRQNPRLCYKGDKIGLIIDEPLERRAFGESVKRISEENSGQVVSTTPLSISGFDAVEAVIEYPNVGSQSIKVFIHKDDRLIEVSFVTPVEDFPTVEPLLRKSIASIKVQSPE